MTTLHMTELDAVTRRVSCFTSFMELLDAQGNYRPTILIDRAPTKAGDEDRRTLARHYNAAQCARGDVRRAFTGTATHLVQVGDTVYFWANLKRAGRVEKVGPKRVTVSFVYRYELEAARRERRAPRRTTRTIRLSNLRERGQVGIWDGITG